MPCFFHEFTIGLETGGVSESDLDDNADDDVTGNGDVDDDPELSGEELLYAGASLLGKQLPY